MGTAFEARISIQIICGQLMPCTRRFLAGEEGYLNSRSIGHSINSSIRTFVTTSGHFITSTRPQNDPAFLPPITELHCATMQ